MKCSSGCVCSLKRAQRRPCTASSSLPCGRRAVSAAKLHRFPSLALRLGSVGFPLALPVVGERFALAGRSKVPLQPASSVALLHSVRSWLPPCEACHLEGGPGYPGDPSGLAILKSSPPGRAPGHRGQMSPDVAQTPSSASLPGCGSKPGHSVL